MSPLRFLKFGTVGASGTLVNLSALYLGQEYLFAAVSQPSLRLNASLVFAIFAATVNNFAWNRRWTWADRARRHAGALLLVQFWQYALACWLGVALQVSITNLLAAHVHYLVANLTAIAAASIINFTVNDRWTFTRIDLSSRARTRGESSRIST